MEIIEQDLLAITKGGICHQTNCQPGHMGGLAGLIAAKYPKVREESIKYIKGFNTKREALGTVQYVPITKDLTVLNLYGQFGYGRSTPNHRTDYEALRKIAKELEALPLDIQQQLYMPYNMGCGLGGGDWNTVQEIFKNIAGYWCKNV